MNGPAPTKLPRFTVTQEQAEQLAAVVAIDGLRYKTPGFQRAGDGSVTLRLPEQPTMPCGVCDGTGRGTLSGRRQSWLICGECMDVPVPIPEGTRVEVGWWAEWRNAGEPREWHPVATATLAESEWSLRAGVPWTEGTNYWAVTLTDIEAVEG